MTVPSNEVINCLAFMNDCCKYSFQTIGRLFGTFFWGFCFEASFSSSSSPSSAEVLFEVREVNGNKCFLKITSESSLFVNQVNYLHMKYEVWICKRMTSVLDFSEIVMRY